MLSPTDTPAGFVGTLVSGLHDARATAGNHTVSALYELTAHLGSQLVIGIVWRPYGPIRKC